MAITVIRTAPDPASYTALEEYQAQTPESLTNVEVLHYSSDVAISFTPSTASPFATSSGKAYVTSKHLPSYPSLTTTRIFTLWSPTEEKGVTIPYTNISLHAAQAVGARGENAPASIYMQLEGASHLTSEPATNGHGRRPSEEDEEDSSDLVEVHLVPADESTCNTHLNS